MVFENRKTIVDTLANFKDTEYAKVFDKWHFYFNKQIHGPPSLLKIALSCIYFNSASQLYSSSKLTMMYHEKQEWPLGE